MKPLPGRRRGGAEVDHQPLGAGELACETCGSLPQPPRARLTTANVAIMVPIELGANVVAVSADLPFVLKILVMTAVTSGLAIWVAEPSVMKLMRGWLHRPALRRRRHLHEAPALWRVRTGVEDRPGALEHLAGALSRAGVNILNIQVYPGEGRVVDELVVSSPEEVAFDDLADAVRAGGGRETRIWPTTAFALVDPVTHALSLALRVVADPEELATAAAELLRAGILAPDEQLSSRESATVVKILSAHTGVHILSRPGEPFSPVERVRASRLAELAELALHNPGCRWGPEPLSSSDKRGQLGVCEHGHVQRR